MRPALTEATDRTVDPRHIAGLTTTRLAELDLEPTPAAYTLWYHYYDGDDPKLVAEIERRLKAGDTIDDDVCSEIYAGWLAPRAAAASEGGAIAAEVSAISGRLKSTVDSALETMHAARDKQARYGKALAGVWEQVAAPDGADELRTAVTAARGQTQRVIEGQQALAEQLRDAGEEAGELSANLDSLCRENNTDPLTGLVSRDAFNETLVTAADDARGDGVALSLLVIDLDYFRAFNTRFGRGLGDEVLKLVAGNFKSTVKGRDTAARVGSDQFAIVLPSTDIKGAATVGDQIRAIVGGRKMVHKATGAKVGRITLSVGAAQLRADEPVADLVRRAQDALATAKHQGRNRVVAERPAATPHGSDKKVVAPAAA